MKQIKLKNSTKFAEVRDGDFELLNQYEWFIYGEQVARWDSDKCQLVTMFCEIEINKKVPGQNLSIEAVNSNELLKTFPIHYRTIVQEQHLHLPHLMRMHIVFLIDLQHQLRKLPYPINHSFY